jgi:hypothetical protein
VCVVGGKVGSRVGRGLMAGEVALRRVCGEAGRADAARRRQAGHTRRWDAC